jgi:hypothetical protein
MSVSASPASRRRVASATWNALNFGFRPKRTPLAIARVRPSPARASISDRSNSARPPSMVIINRPCADVVFAKLYRAHSVGHGAKPPEDRHHHRDDDQHVGRQDPWSESGKMRRNSKVCAKRHANE